MVDVHRVHPSFLRDDDHAELGAKSHRVMALAAGRSMLTRKRRVVVGLRMRVRENVRYSLEVGDGKWMAAARRGKMIARK